MRFLKAMIMLRDRLITGDSSQDKVLAHCNTTCIYRSSCEAKLQSVRATSRQLVHQRVLAAGNITGINADEAERLQMPDQAPVTAAWLGKPAHAVQVGDQRLHRLEWGWVEIQLATLFV